MVGCKIKANSSLAISDYEAGSEIFDRKGSLPICYNITVSYHTEEKIIKTNKK